MEYKELVEGVLIPPAPRNRRKGRRPYGGIGPLKKFFSQVCCGNILSSPSLEVNEEIHLYEPREKAPAEVAERRIWNKQ